MSVILGIDHHVPDFDSWLARLEAAGAALTRIDAHHVVVYRSIDDEKRVFVTVGLRHDDPDELFVPTASIIDCFDATGTEPVPPVFVGRVLDKLNVPQPVTRDDFSGFVVASIGTVDSAEGLRQRITDRVDRLRADGVRRFWTFQALDDPAEVMLLQEVDSEERARAWIRHRDRWAAYVSGPGVGVYPSVFIGTLARLITPTGA